MRELTTLENETFRTEYRKFMDYQSTVNDVELNRFKFGFIAGLETQDSRIAELERQLAEAKRAIFILEQLPLGITK